jgi:hypothetical protein
MRAASLTPDGILVCTLVVAMVAGLCLVGLRCFRSLNERQCQ